jgi:26S proteasome regulatory subunit N7
MAPYLATLLETDASLLPPAAKELLPKLEAKNAETLAKFDKELTESEESMGETEVSDVLRRKAAYLAQIGDKVRH